MENIKYVESIFQCTVIRLCILRYCLIIVRNNIWLYVKRIYCSIIESYAKS